MKSRSFGYFVTFHKCPKEILKQFEDWKKVIELSGPSALRAIPGFKDHALRGPMDWSQKLLFEYPMASNLFDRGTVDPD